MIVNENDLNLSRGTNNIGINNRISFDKPNNDLGMTLIGCSDGVKRYMYVNRSFS